MTSLLKFEDVYFNYPGGDPVLKGLSFEVRVGETLAFLGPNGSGKSTSIKCGLGIQSPVKGNIHSVSRNKLGYVPQTSEFPEQARVCDLVNLVAGHYEDSSDQTEVVQAFGVDEFWKMNANNLSGGQKRCISLAMAFIGHPELVVLDEPSVGIDIEMRERLSLYIRKYSDQGGSILLTTHYIEEAEQLSNRVILLNQGQIIREGGVKEVRDSLGVSRIRYFNESGELIELLSQNSDQEIENIVRNKNYRNLEVQSASLEEAIRGIISGGQI